jgi:hypothetical protein
MSFPEIKHDPNAVLDYTIDWSDWLPSGDTILSSSWSVPAGLTEDSSSNTSTTATVWISGGTAGTNYRITNHITTTEGRQDDRTIPLFVLNR